MKGGMEGRLLEAKLCKLDKSLMECRLLFFIRGGGEAKLSEL